MSADTPAPPPPTTRLAMHSINEKTLTAYTLHNADGDRWCTCGWPWTAQARKEWTERGANWHYASHIVEALTTQPATGEPDPDPKTALIPSYRIDAAKAAHDAHYDAAHVCRCGVTGCPQALLLQRIVWLEATETRLSRGIHTVAEDGLKTLVRLRRAQAQLAALQGPAAS